MLSNLEGVLAEHSETRTVCRGTEQLSVAGR